MISNFAKASAIAIAVTVASPTMAQQSLGDTRSTFDSAPDNKNWSGEVTPTERGHLLGNAEAETKLIEFVSYTCSACAAFAMQGDPAIELSLIAPGDMAVEVRPVIRNELDVTVTLLANCGDPKKFKARHSAFLWSQNSWLKQAANAPQTQQAIWQRGDAASRLNASTALNLGARVIALGTTPSEVTACLSDEKAAQALIDKDKANKTEFGFNSTPSFALNGDLLEDVHQWQVLYPVLAEEFKPQPTSENGLSGGN